MRAHQPGASSAIGSPAVPVAERGGRQEAPGEAWRQGGRMARLRRRSINNCTCIQKGGRRTLPVGAAGQRRAQSLRGGGQPQHEGVVVHACAGRRSGGWRHGGKRTSQGAIASACPGWGSCPVACRWFVRRRPRLRRAPAPSTAPRAPRRSCAGSAGEWCTRGSASRMKWVCSGGPAAMAHHNAQNGSSPASPEHIDLFCHCIWCADDLGRRPASRVAARKPGR